MMRGQNDCPGIGTCRQIITLGIPDRTAESVFQIKRITSPLSVYFCGVSFPITIRDLFSFVNSSLNVLFGLVFPFYLSYNI